MVGGRCHDAGINLGPVEMIAPYVLLASRACARRARLVLANVPGGIRGQQVLRVVAGTTANIQAAIASQLGVTRTVVTYLIDEQKSAGLVERAPDPADRRNRLITTTGAGRALLRDLDRRIRRLEDEVFYMLTQEERQALSRLLHKAASGLDALEGPALSVGLRDPLSGPRLARGPSSQDMAPGVQSRQDLPEAKDAEGR